MSGQRHRSGVPDPEEYILTRIALDALRVKMQTGGGITLAEQRALLSHVDKLQKHADTNLDRLVAAREKFDVLAAMKHDGTKLSEQLLVGLLELGTTLGRSA
jgi:hypothetical protein